MLVFLLGLRGRFPRFTASIVTIWVRIHKPAPSES
jgi:hypothetical protein